MAGEVEISRVVYGHRDKLREAIDGFLVEFRGQIADEDQEVYNRVIEAAEDFEGGVLQAVTLQTDAIVDDLEAKLESLLESLLDEGDNQLAEALYAMGQDEEDADHEGGFARGWMWGLVAAFKSLGTRIPDRAEQYE